MIKEAEGVSADVEALLAEPTQENLLKAQDLNAKFKGLADDIELFRKAESDAFAHKEFLAQPVDLHPRDGVFTRVEIGGPAQHFGGNAVFAKLPSLTRKVFFRDIFEQLHEPLRPGKGR